VKPVCLVIGAGAGIGGNVARRFAQEGYHACLCRRTDEAGLNKLVESIEREGGSATGYLLNAVEPDSIEERVAAIESDIGPIEVVVYNLTRRSSVAGVWRLLGCSGWHPSCAR
jgi:NAD(P)-dependent dehydrogenase (short-subunit alcohol dehydrogenase family)